MIPAAILADLEVHVSQFAEPTPTGWVFVGAEGGRLRRSNFRKLWVVAVREAGLADRSRFHDLRHTGDTLAAATGASTKDFMSRMGHASPRAALIYGRATPDRDAVIAAALSDLVREVTHKRGPSRDPPSLVDELSHAVDAHGALVRNAIICRCADGR